MDAGRIIESGTPDELIARGARKPACGASRPAPTKEATEEPATHHRPPQWTAWRTITAFGIVSLAGDMVDEGMRSVSGPLLAGRGSPPSWSDW